MLLAIGQPHPVLNSSYGRHHLKKIECLSAYEVQATTRYSQIGCWNYVQSVIEP